MPVGLFGYGVLRLSVGCIGVKGSPDSPLKGRERGAGSQEGVACWIDPPGWGRPLGLGLGLACWLQCLVLGFRLKAGDAHFPLNTADEGPAVGTGGRAPCRSRYKSIHYRHSQSPPIFKDRGFDEEDSFQEINLLN